MITQIEHDDVTLIHTAYGKCKKIQMASCINYHILITNGLLLLIEADNLK